MANEKALRLRREILEQLYEMEMEKPGRQGIWHADRHDPECMHRKAAAEYLKAKGLVQGLIGVDGEMALSPTPDGIECVEAGGWWSGIAAPSGFPSAPTDQDRVFMRMAIEQARKSKTEDDRVHPMVGAVAVQDGEVIGTAYRGELADGEHGEYTLLERKLKDAKLAGATVYVTLEPCTDRNPPKVECATRLKSRNVKRVFIGMLDPDERIRGQGAISLRKAGIDVQLFPAELAAQVEELNREFIQSKEAAAKAPRAQQATQAAPSVQINIHNSTIGGDVVAGDKKS